MPFETKTKYGTQRDNTELILRTLEGIKRVLQSINAAGPGGDATLAEQLNQTVELQNMLSELTISLNTANSPSHEELTNPSNVSYTGFKELRFKCSGTVTVTLDGNSIVYPKALLMPDASNVYAVGDTIKADTTSTNSITFNGTGTVLVSITQ